MERKVSASGGNLPNFREDSYEKQKLIASFRSFSKRYYDNCLVTFVGIRTKKNMLHYNDSFVIFLTKRIRNYNTFLFVSGAKSITGGKVTKFRKDSYEKQKLIASLRSLLERYCDNILVTFVEIRTKKNMLHFNNSFS